MAQPGTRKKMDHSGSDADASYDLVRQAMVQEQLRAKAIRDERVLAAMAAIPRELFVRPQDRSVAYDDRALPIDLSQTISQPYMVAIMTEWLDVQDHHRVLEIGTGSGYQAAVLARLSGHVYTLERLAPLSEQARRLLMTLGVTNVTCLVGDGTCGYPAYGPYDRIIVTAGAPSVPPALLEQLADGGKLVIPVGAPDEQVLTRVEKQSSRYVEIAGIACRFVPLIGQQAWPGPAGEGSQAEE
jgi:protein-L-isoaspartate(D-aspartate) O-methyltransferase